MFTVTPTAFAALASLAAFSVPIMGTAVTCYAIGKVRDALTHMLRTHIGFGMLMAAVTGVLPLIARRMASGARDIVILVEYEES